MSVSGKHFYRFRYLQSEEWKGVRLIALAKHGAKCDICGKVDWSNDAHHKRYPKNVFETKPNDLVVLCRKCHDEVHAAFSHKQLRSSNWAMVKRGLRQKDPNNCRCTICGTKDHLSQLRRIGAAFLFICNNCKVHNLMMGRALTKPKASFWRVIDTAREWHYQERLRVEIRTSALDYPNFYE